MPPGYKDEGLQAAKQIREHHPGTAVLLLSQYVESGYALELLHEGAEGVRYRHLVRQVNNCSSRSG